jgi:protein-tyrosine-phosphatase
VDSIFLLPISAKSTKGDIIMIPQKVLCVCHGNSDRSPLMAAVLEMYLKNAGIKDVVIESAGILEHAKNGGLASNGSLMTAWRLGLDLSTHQKRWAGDVPDLHKFDLIIGSDIEATGYMFEQLGVAKEKLFRLDIPDPWPSTDRRDHDQTAEAIMAGMFRVLFRRFAIE